MADVNVSCAYCNYSPFFPNPITCLREIVLTGVKEFTNRFPFDGLGPWARQVWEQHYHCFYMGWTEVMHIAAMAIGLTVLRMVLNFVLLERIPKWFKLDPKEGSKFPESIWKVLFYSVAWLWAAYLCFIGEGQYFFYPVNHWNDWSPGLSIPTAMYWLYILQLGFYIHCLYASVFIETIRRDIVLLMIHHFLTLALCGYSYAVRYHKIALLVLFVQDVGDIWLELSKTIFYFKVRDGKEDNRVVNLANVSFAVFTIEWVLFRMYWLPTKAMYSSGHTSMIFYANGPFYLPFNLMLWILYVMQVYWFTFIVALLVRVLSGKEIKDNREFEEDEIAAADRKKKE